MSYKSQILFLCCNSFPLKHVFKCTEAKWLHLRVFLFKSDNLSFYYAYQFTLSACCKPVLERKSFSNWRLITFLLDQIPDERRITFGILPCHFLFKFLPLPSDSERNNGQVYQKQWPRYYHLGFFLSFLNRRIHAQPPVFLVSLPSPRLCCLAWCQFFITCSH